MILSGDTRQHRSVERGDALRILERVNPGDGPSKTWQEVADNLADKKYLGYQMAPWLDMPFHGPDQASSLSSNLDNHEQSIS